MKNLTLLMCSLLATALFAAAAVGGITDDIRAAQAARIEATLHADSDALEMIYASDLVYAHSDGRVDERSVLLANIAAGTVDYQKIDIVEQDIRVVGDVGIITGSADFFVVAGGQVNEMTLRFTAVYVFRDERWQFASWHSSRIPSAAS